MPKVLIEDIQLSYNDVGSGPAVVLIHGYPFNRTLWTEQVSALKETNRVIVPDLRGFGETDTGNALATMSRMALDVKFLLDHLQIDQALECGLSMGGYVTVAFHKAFTSRVAGLVLANTRAEPDTEQAKTSRKEQAEK